MADVMILMGVSGCGKTTVGQALAERLGVSFYDADDYHPAENVAKMSRGQPLNDDDRYPWLARLHELITEHVAAGQTMVLGCSALKQKYRDQLRGEHESVRFVHLKGSFDLIWQRMQAREGHYMKASMLRSQFEALEEPNTEEALVVSISGDVESIVDTILRMAIQ